MSSKNIYILGIESSCDDTSHLKCFVKQKNVSFAETAYGFETGFMILRGLINGFNMRRVMLARLF